MMDEHISEYSNFETLCISVCSLSHTRAYPTSESIGLSTIFIHLLIQLLTLASCHTGAYLSSLGSSDLSQASLSFDLVVDPHELSYWGISSSTEFACIVIQVIFWLWAIRSVIHPVNFSLVRVGAAPISIDHLPISLSLSFLVGTAPISIGHHLISLSLSQGRTYIDRPYSYHFSCLV